jgi:hypothetical protein
MQAAFPVYDENHLGSCFVHIDDYLLDY